ncbi:hypothetical protein SAMN05216298_4927 [Glycomyces sambucus]|uniref:Uncharacterized protein n=1 Tax=Glycomyces sambucus TaxID=380244 RepID=A0A1G9MF73_9ACTN|nr:hypothetical protein [Glycomyces sambucus]SDL72651.1 hypothetical protein SAMN05216298_4927 [Glycomyces sambucus]
MRTLLRVAVLLLAAAALSSCSAEEVGLVGVGVDSAGGPVVAMTSCEGPATSMTLSSAVAEPAASASASATATATATATDPTPAATDRATESAIGSATDEATSSDTGSATDPGTDPVPTRPVPAASDPATNSATDSATNPATDPAPHPASTVPDWTTRRTELRLENSSPSLSDPSAISLSDPAPGWTVAEGTAPSPPDPERIYEVRAWPEDGSMTLGAVSFTVADLERLGAGEVYFQDGAVERIASFAEFTEIGLSRCG